MKEAGTDLVPQALASDNGNFIANTLIGLEVQGQFWVVTFDYDFGRFFDGLCANATLYFVETISLGGLSSYCDWECKLAESHTILAVTFGVKFEVPWIEVVNVFA